MDCHPEFRRSRREEPQDSIPLRWLERDPLTPRGNCAKVRISAHTQISAIQLSPKPLGPKPLRTPMCSDSLSQGLPPSVPLLTRPVGFPLARRQIIDVSSDAGRAPLA